jgi:superfamily I DNA/RNA helicase/mRNA-degrading endonuclease RelE of RelBE toxin-antitoxin system
MAATWLLTMKPTFMSEWQALPAKEAQQIHSKLALLTEDPTPDGKVKKRLEHFEGKICRIRSGDYRLFYTFEKPYVSVLALRKRDEKTYDGGVGAEKLGGLDAELRERSRPSWSDQIDTPLSKKSRKEEKHLLPNPITEELLRRLSVPESHWRTLAAITTEEDLLNCNGVPDDVLLLIDQAIGQRPIAAVMQERDLVVQKADDLLRYKDGELLGFLLKLNPEQEKFVAWGMKATGPTLLKGGPGTGKSTVALYRARAMIEALKRAGIERPRLLFTTYTNALVRFSEQLLASLLGDDARLVTVRTADSLVMEAARHGGRQFTLADSKEVLALVAQAGTTATFSGNTLQKKAQAQTVERLGIDYLVEEISGVIYARRIATLDAYQEAARPGRQIALNRVQREGVWRVREALGPLLRERGKHLWQEIRGFAAELAENGDAGQKYDAVVVDEAQDLEPSVLQFLVASCKEPNRLFLTADANQSIYGGGFRWTDVHSSLRFQGRTGVLKANHRSTREIGEAAHQYLQLGELDDERAERSYMHEGPRPAVRAVRSFGDQIALLERFLRSAATELRLAIGSFAVLVPSEKEGKRIADGLVERGVQASFMSGKELDLAAKTVKVITLKSAKGLEFPAVALAGFDGGYPWIKDGLSDEERDEALSREQRTMYVAMTRAMRALLVVLPEASESPLFQGFDSRFWNLGSHEEV